MSDQHKNAIKGKIGYIIAGIFALILIMIIFTSIGKQGTALPVSTPASTNPVATAAPEGVIEEDTLAISDNSQIPSPTVDQIWVFETAYNTPNALLRSELLTSVATAQYIEANRDESVSVFSISVEVNRDESVIEEVAVNELGIACVVVTNTVINVSEGGATQKVALPKHTSYWINTPEGWKVARNAESN